MRMGPGTAGLLALTAAALLAPAGLRAQAAPAGASSAVRAAAVPAPGPWLERIGRGLAGVESEARAGRLTAARQAALRLYLDEYELLEASYGASAGGTPVLAPRIAEVEARFHELLRAPDAAAAAQLAAGLRGRVSSLARLAQSLPAVPAVPVAAAGEPASSSTGAAAPALAESAGRAGGTPARVRAPELRAVLAQLDTAEAAWRGGRSAEALGRVEQLYLDGIEPLEARLPQAEVHALERSVHLGVRAALGRGAPAAETGRRFAELRARLLAADAALGPGAPAWLGALNAFAILVREGLEAVLLIAALLAYLAAAGAGVRARRQIYAGVGAGVLATAATWGVAELLVPVGGGSRELVEGITGLVAVVVLLYVSNWLFQKTYIHDWKDYLRQHVGKAVTTGSALAMASLAFAAVYREGFETVLFYQALLFDAGPGPVLAGAIPGALLIAALGYGIIRLGVKLPLKKVFTFTNAILLYLAFTFVGKGLYNLQEAGLFAPHPLAGVPDAPLLRQLLGIYPTVETLAAQLLFALGVAGTYLYYRRRLAPGAARTQAAQATPTALPRRAAVAGQ